MADAIAEAIHASRRQFILALLVKSLDTAYSAPSRSAVGRYVQKIDTLAKELEQHRTIAEALVAKGLSMDGSQTAQLNIAMLQ